LTKDWIANTARVGGAAVAEIEELRSAPTGQRGLKFPAAVMVRKPEIEVLHKRTDRFANLRLCEALPGITGQSRVC
jgi:hypothetical protein